MVSGGKPLWYLQMGTTGATFFFTVFFMGLLVSWAKGIDSILADYEAEGGGQGKRTVEDLGKESKLEWYPHHHRAHFMEFLYDFRRTIRASTLWFNLIPVLVCVAGGVFFAYTLYKTKTRVLYAQVWFGLVSVYALVWMVTSVVLYVDLEELAGEVHKDARELVPNPLRTMLKWGRENTSTTVIMLIVVPTALYLFLSFVAYRLYSKLEVYENEDPDKPATEYAPGSWIERKTAAEGGTWEAVAEPEILTATMDEEVTVEPAEAPLLRRPSLLKEEEKVQQAELIETKLRDESVSGNIGGWLEDIFDYTF